MTANQRAVKNFRKRNPHYNRDWMRKKRLRVESITWRKIVEKYLGRF